jgi:hypothetical protein
VKQSIRDLTVASDVFRLFSRVAADGLSAYSFRFGTARQDSAQDSAAEEERSRVQSGRARPFRRSDAQRDASLDFEKSEVRRPSEGREPMLSVAASR